MKPVLGVRREDKNEWERRAPLTPEQVEKLITEHGFRVVVQPSAIRIFPDEAYRAAGAQIREDLSECAVVLGVKEMPSSLFRPGTLYMFFSHTIKGQPHNMPMLRRLMDVRAHLVDYERIVDEKGRRLVLFSRYAGLAGMIESLHALGRRLARGGDDEEGNPFLAVSQPHRYGSLQDALKEIREKVGKKIAERGLPRSLHPLVIGILGYGNVARGALEVLESCLPVRKWDPEELLTGKIAKASSRVVHVVVFEERHTVKRRDGGPFVLEDYWNHPEAYEPAFSSYLPHLTVLINAVYWDPRYPVLVSARDLQNLYASPNPRLQVIGDITCDIEGSIQVTRKATSPSNPCYVYDVDEDLLVHGMEKGRGPVIMAVDNLPCEFPAEASADFGDALMPFLPDLCRLDLERDDAPDRLPPPLRNALIVHRGRLTPAYRYLEAHLAESRKA